MPYPKLKLSGRFGRLTIVGPGQKAGRRTTWKCRCDCGNDVIVETVRLRRKVRPVRSCGCLVADRSREANLRHGMRHTPTYSSWLAMLDRCGNPRTKDWPRYGARGITVCERWRRFENFLADMGVRPDGTSIDRFPDTNGNYEPGNCRWATPTQQARNRRTTIMIKLPAAALAEVVGLSPEVLARRLRRGWDPVQAISTPLQTSLSRPQGAVAHSGGKK